MTDVPEGGTARPSRLGALLLVSAFVVATCGLIYELLAGTLASYLLGDSVTQFSTIIGTYLFAMGMGSWCSRYVRTNELATFVRVEVLIAAIGGGVTLTPASLSFVMVREGGPSTSLERPERNSWILRLRGG